MKGGEARKPWYVPVFAVLILSVVILSQAGVPGEVLLIPIALAFLLGFGLIIGIAVKEWKKPDEEILSGFSVLAQSSAGGKEISLANRKKFFLGALGVAGFSLVEIRDKNALIFLALALLLFFALLLPDLRRKPRKKERLVKPETIIALIMGLVTCGFFCFFIGIGIYHGAWWFVLPPGLCFLSVFSRPLVAAVRTLLRLPQLRRDRGEGHVRRGKEIDPWDRPDIDINKYQRKR